MTVMFVLGCIAGAAFMALSWHWNAARRAAAPAVAPALVRMGIAPQDATERAAAAGATGALLPV